MSIKKPESTNQIYTITSGIELTWKQFFNHFQKRMKKKQIFYIPKFFVLTIGALSNFLHFIYPRFKPDLTLYRIKRVTSNTSYDISKMIDELGVFPEKDYTKELDIIVDWYLEEKSKNRISTLRKR